MKNFVFIVVCFLMLTIPAVTNAGIDERKIVVFKAGAGQDEKRQAVNNAGGALLKHLDLINGAAIRLPAKLENKLKASNIVEGIYPDAVVRPARSLFKTDQETPWGVSRISADRAWRRSTGEGVRVAVIDSGIDLDHPDLAGNVKGGFNAINHKQSYNDGLGHGTQVAGIIAALNNDFGTVGTSYNVSLYAVKVLDDTGYGRLSDLIEGLGWAVKNHMQVVNISLVTSQEIAPFRKAISRANAAGLVIVAASGNKGGATAYPAAYPEVISVSAVDRHDKLASFSNFGKIELAAPGVDILSTIPDGLIPDTLYYPESGTSMACPHVTGTIALILATVPTENYDANGNGLWDPDEIKRKLADSAEPLAGLSSDQQGWGLVRADRAVD